MNDEQTEEFLCHLKDIKNALLDKQVVREVVVPIKPNYLKRLEAFKELITENSFWTSLTKEQREKILSLKVKE